MYEVGFSRIDITPEIGSIMAGHVGLKRSTGIADRLYAKAMSITGDNRTVVFVSVDVLFIDARTIQAIKERVGQETVLDPQYLFCSSTHTHSGPMTTGLFGREGQDGYVLSMIDRIVESIKVCVKNAEKANLYVSKTRVKNIAFCERIIMKGGRIETHPYRYDPDIIAPESVTDDELYVITAARDNQYLGMYVNFANHPQAMERENALISADYPGSIENSLQQAFGQNFVMLFGAGACGNVCPVNAMSRDNVEIGEAYKQYMGQTIASSVLDSLKSKDEIIGEIKVVNSSVVLKRREIAREKLQRAYDYIDTYKPVEAPVCSNYGVEGEGSGTISLKDYLQHPYWKLQESMDIIKLHNLNQASIYEAVGINGISFQNGLALLTTPFELFCDTGIEIKTYSPFKHTMIIELCNGSAGYLPTEKAFTMQGGYETLTLVSSRFTENSNRIVISKAIEILEELLRS
jgi:neutral ceramidase